MAVASETAERIGSLPVESFASKSAPALESESSSPPTNTCDADSPRSSDVSNSSVNPNRDFEIQSALRTEEYRQLFRLPPDEVLIQDFNCAFQESILLQGHMYLFSGYICFYSNIFGFETKKVIPFTDISSVRRAKTAGIFPNAIEILAGERKYFFASFLSRDEAFKLINDGWLQCTNGGREIMEEQESVRGSNSLDNDELAILKVDSFRHIDKLDSDDRDKEASPSNDHNLSAPPIVEIERVPVRLAEVQSNVEKDAEPVGEINPSSTMLATWNEENADAPEIRKSYTKVGETKFQIKVENFFNLFFSDGANTFIESFHHKCGDKDFRCSLWQPQKRFEHIRDVSFQHPIKIYFGAKFGGCQETQKFRVYRNSHLVIETSQEINDVPYGDYFRVEGLWDVVKYGDGPNEGCILQIYVDVAFSKRTVFKGKIVQSTLDECREAYATWINLAHELLKQKNLEGQEGGRAAIKGPCVIQTEINSGSEVRNIEASESSQLNDPRREAHMSGSLNVHELVGDLRNEHLTNATTVASSLGEYAAKFCTFLKSQSRISLILAVAFVVILLMQVSILVLLNRPQPVYLSSPGDYYMGGISSPVGDRSTDAVARLEKRMHLLKDELFIVEGKLERLRHEHSWLKAQLKDIDGLRKRK